MPKLLWQQKIIRCACGKSTYKRKKNAQRSYPGFTVLLSIGVFVEDVFQLVFCGDNNYLTDILVYALNWYITYVIGLTQLDRLG